MLVATIGLLGDDADGRILKSQAQREGLECSGLVTIEGSRTTFTDAFTSEETGRRTHLYYPGTSGLMTPDHFDFDGNRARILHLGLPGLHEQMDKRPSCEKAAKACTSLQLSNPVIRLRIKRKN